jgi:hypothetical protein
VWVIALALPIGSSGRFNREVQPVGSGSADWFELLADRQIAKSPDRKTRKGEYQ